MAFSGKFGEEKSTIAIDKLNVTACWSGFSKPRRENSATYSSPPGWVIVGHATHIHSSNNGWRSVSVLNQGTQYASKEDMRSAYHEAHDLAVSLKDRKAAANIKTEEASALKAYTEIANSGNSVVRAVVGAQPRGTAFIDTCRGWEEISVRVTERYVGTKESILEDLKSKYKLYK
ncbi:hypothetical protein BSKO_13950 [Bryopsis sp. KO-2023]|nr:hypothetical protein BSKO_13950 [Bryopsis sp. KO-2023]